ncbi:fumarylacetoacetate hydrolase family protein [Streptomyces sp. B21-083]|uniref:fumarylacetoacetate hydrolase family protein n=1 Tax=Streptomyces sp. B21-083 TaxID=3039410 RepID=UPI002FEF418B
MRWRQRRPPCARSRTEDGHTGTEFGLARLAAELSYVRGGPPSRKPAGRADLPRDVGPSGCGEREPRASNSSASCRAPRAATVALLAQTELLRAEQRRVAVLDERARIAREIRMDAVHAAGPRAQACACVIQHQSPFQAAVPFLVIQGVTPLIWPLLVRLLHRVGPGPMLVTGFVSLAGAQLWLRAVPIHESGLVPLLGPLVLNGVGFGLVVAALTAAAVNVVPPNLTGMARATTSLVRDLGQTLGPAKGKDTSTTLGPWLVTADELEPHRNPEGFLDVALTVQVNGETVGRDRLGNMAWTFEEMAAYASRGTWIRPGDILGSGTCGNGGCLAELWGRAGTFEPPPVVPGDIVTMTVEGIGTISNTVVEGVPPIPLPAARRRG